MKRSHLLAVAAAAALVISASGPALAAEATVDANTIVPAAPIAAAPEAMPAIASADIDRVAFVPAPRLTYAVLYTTTSPSALAFGTAAPSSSSIA
ncbi:MAG: hypothetical protein KIH67_001145 [Candidatus Moranbacteria bacterium]|nr:hypothetical protein [Candidatus Moranbacteria bacterium]